MSATDRTVNVGLIGLGTVGGGVARLIARHADEYRASYGVDVRIKRACALDAAAAAELGFTGDAFTEDWHEVVGDPAIDIVVELIGGEHPATEIFEAAFAGGKHVVSANKALLGLHMERLAGLARVHGVQLRCEASAGGGIPIVGALEHALVGNKALTVAGILNGTTNYILSRMDAEGLDFDTVLADAQRLGYAEADPSADVDGFDAASKVAILSSIAFHTRVTTDDVLQEGIRAITATDIAEAHRLGYTVKLLGIARNTAAGVEARVHPTMIPAAHMLAGVSGAMNAVYVVGDAAGETMFYGAGAGSFPTASAVVGDILELARAITQNAVTPEPEPFGRVLPMRPADEVESRRYVRLEVSRDVDATAQVRDAFAQAGVELARLELIEGDTSLVAVTGPVSNAAFEGVRRELEALEGVTRVASMIRIEDVDAWREGAEANE